MGDKNMWSKEERVKKEISRLKNVFKTLDKNKLNTVISLIQNAAFMTVTLEELQQSINENGCTSEYQNGENQFGVKKSPEVEIHIAMTKNHAAIIKQLADLAPRAKKNNSNLNKMRCE